jgi:hypothetical protein
MTTKTTDRHGVRLDGRYVDAVRCLTEHAGNRRFAPTRSGWYQCQGCAKLVSSDYLRQRQTDAAAGRDVE